jgi:hypothetical protein
MDYSNTTDDFLSRAELSTDDVSADENSHGDTSPGSITDARLAGLPDEPLISVAPPNAKGIPEAGWGKAPAEVCGETDSGEIRYQGLSAWQKGTQDANSKRVANRDGANCGLVLGLKTEAGQFLAFDGDFAIDTPEQIERSLKLCQTVRNVVSCLYDVLFRESRPGRIAFLVRIPNEEFAGHKLVHYLNKPGTQESYGKIELLTTGEQIVIAGVHQHAGKIFWYGDDDKAVTMPAPALSGIPELKDLNAFYDLVGFVLGELEKIGVSSISDGRAAQRQRRADDGTVKQSNLADFAAPSAAALITYCQELPHNEDVDRDTYSDVNLAVEGARRGLWELGKLTTEENQAIIIELIRWSTRWKPKAGKPGTTWDKEAAKYKEDWSTAVVRSGWRKLGSIASDLKVRDMYNRLDVSEPKTAAVDDFSFTERAAPGPADADTSDSTDNGTDSAADEMDGDTKSDGADKNDSTPGGKKAGSSKSDKTKGSKGSKPNAESATYSEALQRAMNRAPHKQVIQLRV